jgi:hypothetical protein
MGAVRRMRTRLTAPLMDYAEVQVLNISDFQLEPDSF